MYVDINRNSRIGKWYWGWYARTGEVKPSADTDCDIREILIYQFFHWVRFHSVFGTHLRPWMFILVGFFALASALAPSLMVWFVIIPVIILIAVVIALPLAGLWWGITRLSVVERVFYFVVEKLSDPVGNTVDFVKSLNTRMWQIRVFGRRVAWVVIPVILIVFHTIMFAWYSYNENGIAFVIAYVMFLVEYLCVALYLCAIAWAVHEEYDPIGHVRQLPGKVLGKPSRAVRQFQAQKPKGLYRILIDIGICRYVRWFDA